MRTIALIGAGNRGAEVYADYVRRHPERARLVAAADPDAARLERLARSHDLDGRNCYSSAAALLDRERLADGLIIATPDANHVESALLGLERGYNMLLEKPIAPSLEGLGRIAAAARRHSASITVAHVLRHTPFFQTIKRLVDEGRVGRPMSIQHAENIGFWHFCHSYVRGNWRRSDTSSPLILAKACHDFDVLRWLVGVPCEAVSSFGELTFFRPEAAPAGAGRSCLECAVERSCPFSALRIYMERFGRTAGWPISVLTLDDSEAGRLRALREGPYGRCVFRCDNDAVDHQIAALTFANGVTATLSVCAFTADNTRTIRIHGSLGELLGRMDTGEIELRDFLSGSVELIEIEAPVNGHCGGDEALMQSFIAQLAARHAGRSGEELSSLWETMEGHVMALAAEDARRSGTVVSVSDLLAGLNLGTLLP